MDRDRRICRYVKEREKHREREKQLEKDTQTEKQKVKTRELHRQRVMGGCYE